MTTKYIFIVLSGFFLLQTSYAVEITNSDNFSGIVITGKNPITSNLSLEKKIENGLTSSKNFTSLIQEITGSLNKSKNITTNINYLNQINKSIAVLEKKYSSNESYKKILNSLKSYVAFLLKEQTALKNKEGEKSTSASTIKNPIIPGGISTPSETNTLIKTTPEELAKYMRNLQIELESKVVEDNNFYYINNAVSLSKKQFDGFELYDKNSQFCPSGYSIGLRNISPYNQEALGYFFTKNPTAFPISGLNGNYKWYTFWTAQDNWTNNFMAKNPKEKALNINNNLIFKHETISMIDYAKAWKNVALPPNEYYITQHGGSVGSTSYSYVMKKSVICTNNLLKNQELKNIKTLNNEISDSGFFAKLTWSVLGGYYETLALNTYNKNDVELYDFYLPVKLGNNYLFYKKDRTHNSTATQQKKENKIIQGIYQLTEKKYKGNFQKNGDVCTTEFGNEWKISKNSRDAHLMLTKDTIAWDTLKSDISCNNYSILGTNNFGSIYSIQGGVELRNNRVNCNSDFQVACEKRTSTASDNENWKKYLTPVTKSQRDDFMKQINTELSGKIYSDNNFIYLNNYLSISRKEFSGMQLYKDPTVQACPTGFSLAQYEYDGKNNHLASPYTLEVLGYYISKNPNSYKFVELQEIGNQYAHDYRFWIKQDSWINSYMAKFNEEQIRERGYDATFNVFNVRMHNAYLNWKKPLVDNIYYIDDHFGGSDKMLEKRPALCQKNGAKDDFTKLPGSIKKYDGKIIMNQGSSEADSFLMYTYQKIIAEYNGGGDNLYQYFLPLYRDSGYHFYRQSK